MLLCYTHEMGLSWRLGTYVFFVPAFYYDSFSWNNSGQNLESARRGMHSLSSSTPPEHDSDAVSYSAKEERILQNSITVLGVVIVA